MKIKRCFIMCVCTLMPVFLAAGDAMPRALTLEQSLEIAFKHNPGLRMAEKEIRKSEAGTGEAWSAILPSVNGNMHFQKSWDIQTNTIPNFMKMMLEPQPGMMPPEIEGIFKTYTAAMPDYVALSFGLENTWMYGASLQQPLFLGGAGIAGIQAAKAAKMAAENHYEATRQSLIYDVSRAFYGCVLAKSIVDVQESALKMAEANLEVVIKKYDVGSASGFEKMRAQVEVANMRPEVITARNNYQSAITGLHMILGMNKSVMIRVDGELRYENDGYGDQPLEALQEQALAQRPELQSVFATKTVASKGVVIARSRFMPKLFFSTDYSFLAMRNDYDFVQNDFSKGFTSALSLQIPLFTGFRHHKQYQKAQLDFKISEDMEKQAADGILADVEMAYYKFHESREKYHAADESIDLAKEALRLADLTYEEGAGTQLDVLNSQLALTRSRMNHASALFAYQLARYQLRKATGSLKVLL